MQELAPHPVWTIHIFMELLAQPGLVVLRHMRLLLQLIFTMGKRALNDC